MAKKPAAPKKKAASKTAKAAKPAAKATKKPATKAVAAKAEPVKKVRKASKPKNDKTLSYTQSEFVENVRQFCGLTKRAEAKEICEDLSELVIDTLKKGYKIPFFGLGKLYVRKTKPRTGRNPATGESIKIPAKKRVRFTPAKSLKDAVL
jgi:DNA-binding protein HU-beta